MDQLPPLHELDAEVMDRLWEHGEASVRDVMDALNANAAKPRAYTTYIPVLAHEDRHRGARDPLRLAAPAWARARPLRHARVADRARLACQRRRDDCDRLHRHVAHDPGESLDGLSRYLYP
jgi:hypothetical protein